MSITYYFRKLILKLSFSTTKNCILEKPVYLGKNCNFLNSSFGKFSYFGNFCTAVNANVGRFCSIASFVCIGGDSHPINHLSTSIVFYKKKNIFKTYFGKKNSDFSFEQEAKPVNIGHDVWIGEKAFIKGGLNIGTGAIIGAGSVVTHDVLPYEIVGGVPAKHIDFRFDENTIQKLLKSKWWDFDEKDLKSIMANGDPIVTLLGRVS